MKVDLNEIRDGDSIRLACGAVHLVKTVTKPCIREDVNHDFVLLLENGLCHYADRKGNPWSEMKEFQIVEVIQKSEQIILAELDKVTKTNLYQSYSGKYGGCMCGCRGYYRTGDLALRMLKRTRKMVSELLDLSYSLEFEWGECGDWEDNWTHYLCITCKEYNKQVVFYINKNEGEQ
jgi:hypothetical protein